MGADPAAAPCAPPPRLVGDRERFLRACWGKRPHLERGAVPGAGGVLSLGDVDALIEHGLPATAIRLFIDGRTTPPNDHSYDDLQGPDWTLDLPRPEVLAEQIARGATLSIRGIHHFRPPVARFCRALERELGHPIQANAYLVRDHRRGLPSHADEHDIFVVQTCGSKAWECGTAVDLGGGTEPATEVVLEPGDCLYVPAGTVHRAWTEEELSLHVTFGVRTRTWGDALRALAVRLEEPIGPGVLNDEELFAGQLRDRLEDLVALARESGLPRDVLRALWSGRRPPMAAPLSTVLRSLRSPADIVVAARPDHVVRIETDRHEVRLVLWDRTLTLPRKYETALRQLMSRRPSASEELDPRLSAAETAHIVRMLAVTGWLDISDRAQPSASPTGAT